MWDKQTHTRFSRSVTYKAFHRLYFFCQVWMSGPNDLHRNENCLSFFDCIPNIVACPLEGALNLTNQSFLTNCWCCSLYCRQLYTYICKPHLHNSVEVRQICDFNMNYMYNVFKMRGMFQASSSQLFELYRVLYKWMIIFFTYFKKYNLLNRSMKYINHPVKTRHIIFINNIICIKVTNIRIIISIIRFLWFTSEVSFA